MGSMNRKNLAYLIFSIGAGLAAIAVAGPPVLPPLNPPTPSYYTCKATGSGAICRAQLEETLDQEPLGVVCGTSQNPVELLMSGTETARLTRYYDTAGNLTRRFTRDRFEGTIINPVTGLTAIATGLTNLIDTLVVPGNFDTVTRQQTGPFKITLPGSGVLIIDTGRVTFDAEGNVVRHNGHLALLDYFENGNHEEAAKLCAALGSPGTP
jgi:hypothetical protein